MGITHLFQSAKSDGADATLVQPGDWNADHVVDLSGVYALLAGVSGGQTLKGGTGAGENLTLNSTAHATKGKIYFGANSVYDEANSRIGIGTPNPAYPLEIESGPDAGANALGIKASSHVTSERASFFLGSWLILQDSGANGTKNFGIYDATNTAFRLGIGTNGSVIAGGVDPVISDGIGLHVNGKILRLASGKNIGSAGATGNQGEICWDDSYIYVCTATNSWKRAAISTWS